MTNCSWTLATRAQIAMIRLIRRSRCWAIFGSWILPSLQPMGLEKAPTALFISARYVMVMALFIDEPTFSCVSHGHILQFCLRLAIQPISRRSSFFGSTHLSARFVKSNQSADLFQSRFAFGSIISDLSSSCGLTRLRLNSFLGLASISARFIPSQLQYLEASVTVHVNRMTYFLTFRN